MVSCVGQPPSADTNQTLFRPLIFEMKATCLPSVDQAEPPMMRVMYSFSMENDCMSGTVLLSSLVGSVTAPGIASGACGGVETSGGWADAVKVIKRMMMKRLLFKPVIQSKKAPTKCTYIVDGRMGRRFDGSLLTLLVPLSGCRAPE